MHEGQKGPLTDIFFIKFKGQTQVDTCDHLAQAPRAGGSRLKHKPDSFAESRKLKAQATVHVASSLHKLIGLQKASTHKFFEKAATNLVYLKFIILDV